MLKKIWFVAAALLMITGLAFAEVDANKADQVALDGVKGIGPTTSKTILAERKKGGDFKNWGDLESRVKGIGGKKAARLSAAGLTVNGEKRPADSAMAKAKTEKPKDVKTADAGVSAPAKK